MLGLNTYGRIIICISTPKDEICIKMEFDNLSFSNFKDPIGNCLDPPASHPVHINNIYYLHCSFYCVFVHCNCLFIVHEASVSMGISPG